MGRRSWFRCVTPHALRGCLCLQRQACSDWAGVRTQVYHPCMLLAKKRYVGFSYESPSQARRRSP